MSFSKISLKYFKRNEAHDKLEKKIVGKLQDGLEAVKVGGKGNGIIACFAHFPKGSSSENWYQRIC